VVVAQPEPLQTQKPTCRDAKGKGGKPTILIVSSLFKEHSEIDKQYRENLLPSMLVHSLGCDSLCWKTSAKRLHPSSLQYTCNL